MRRSLPKAATGKTGEALSGVFPGSAHPQQTELPLRLVSVQTVQAATADLRHAMAHNCRESGGLEQLCAEMGRPASYSSKLSEALAGVDGKHPSIEVLIAQLRRRDEAALELLRHLNEIGGGAPPVRHRVASKAEMFDALLEELDGKIGGDILDRAAKRLGTDRGAFRP